MLQRYFQNHCAAEVLLLEIGGVGGEKNLWRNTGQNDS